MTQVEATLLGVTVASIALLIGIFTYLLSRGLLPLTPSAKLWDRVYELDKLVLAYPKPFARFMQEVARPNAFFYADSTTVPRNDEYYQLKAMVYFHLNVFEEIYLTTESSKAIAKQFEREGWDEYIFRKMRHPLVREVFDREADQIFTGKFRDFIRANRQRIEGPADTHAF
jgi:hypothetical protein